MQIDSDLKGQGYIWLSTLGGKQKSFWWKVDEKGNVFIKKQEGKKLRKLNSFNLTNVEIDMINKYVKTNNWVELSNSMSKLGDGSEKEGLGKFVYTCIEENLQKAQLVSQIAAIFVNAHVWSSNGKKRGMQFRTNIDNWKEHVLKYYNNEQIKK